MRELNKVMRAEIRAPGSRGSKSNLVNDILEKHFTIDLFISCPIVLPRGRMHFGTPVCPQIERGLEMAG